MADDDRRRRLARRAQRCAARARSVANRRPDAAPSADRISSACPCRRQGPRDGAGSHRLLPGSARGRSPGRRSRSAELVGEPERLEVGILTREGAVLGIQRDRLTQVLDRLHRLAASSGERHRHDVVRMVAVGRAGRARAGDARVPWPHRRRSKRRSPHTPAPGGLRSRRGAGPSHARRPADTGVSVPGARAPRGSAP